jgi:hypothetical protein
MSEAARFCFTETRVRKTSPRPPKRKKPKKISSHIGSDQLWLPGIEPGTFCALHFANAGCKADIITTRLQPLMLFHEQIWNERSIYISEVKNREDSEASSFQNRQCGAKSVRFRYNGAKRSEPVGNSGDDVAASWALKSWRMRAEMQHHSESGRHNLVIRNLYRT